MDESDLRDNADNNNDNVSGSIGGSSAHLRRGRAVRRAKDTNNLPSRPRKRNKRRRPDPTDDENSDSGGADPTDNDRDAPETPAAKQPRTGLYRRVSGVFGRVVGLLTPGRATRKISNGSPAGGNDNNREGDEAAAATDAMDDNDQNDQDQGEEQGTWSPEPRQGRPGAAGKGKGRSGGDGEGRRAVGGGIGAGTLAAAGEDTREAGRSWAGGSGDHYPGGMYTRSRGFGGSPDVGLGVGELLEVAGGKDVAFSPGVRHILRDEMRARSRPSSRGSPAAANGERLLPSGGGNVVPRAFGDGEHRAMGAAGVGERGGVGAIQDVGFPVVGGLNTRRGRYEMEDGADDHVSATSSRPRQEPFVFGADRSSNHFPSDGAAEARSGEGSQRRAGTLQQRRRAAATAVLRGGGHGRMQDEDFETDDGGGDEGNKMSGDEPFTLSEQRDIVRAVRFRRNLPPSAALYILSKMESRQAAHIRKQIMREYRKYRGRTGAAAARRRPAHASLSGSGSSRSPALVAPVARRRVAPPGSELVPTAPLRNAPLMLPPPPRGLSGRTDDTASAAGDRDGMRPGVSYDRRSSAGERMQAPSAPRGGDPDGLLTPARRARAGARQQDSGRER